MAWIILVIAGVFETSWAVGLKYSDGFTKPIPTLLTVASMVVSLFLLGIALRNIPLGTGYAIWTGIGTIGTIIYGIAIFGEPATVARLVCVLLILSGIIGLKLISQS